MSPEIYEYLMKIIVATRRRTDLKVGASPRAAIALKRAAQATALIEGHTFVNPSQIYELLQPVLAHRLILTTEAKMNNSTAKKIVDEIKSEVKVPVFRQSQNSQGMP
jgi:MoxR-like ATPase